MSARIRRAVAGALWIALLANPARAAAPEVFGYFRNSDPSGLLPRREVSSATGPLSDLVLFSWANGAGTASYEVDYGLVRLLAQTSYLMDPPDSANAGPTAGWRDLLTVTAPGVATGTSGTIVLAIRVTGTLTIGAIGGACSYVSIDAYDHIDNCVFPSSAFGPGWGSFSSRLISFYFGFPFDFSVDASADASGSATADLLHTISYDGVVEVRNLVQQETVDTYTITSASGFDYNVPEPSAALLDLAALAALTVVVSGSRWRSGVPRSPRLR